MPKLVSFGSLLSDKVMVADVSAGDRHSLFMTDQGKVYATGSNQEG